MDIRTFHQDQSCDHNGFAHRVFPRIVAEQGRTILDRLTGHAGGCHELLSDAFELTQQLYPHTRGRASLCMKDIVINEEHVAQQKMVTITLTPSPHPITAHFIGLLATIPPSPSTEANGIRYLTFERTDDATPAVLCEWRTTEEGHLYHCNLGFGGSLTQKSFMRAVASLIDFGGYA